MIEQIFARELSPGIWQWCALNKQGQCQRDSLNSGDDETLVQSLPAANTPVSIVLRGQQVVASEVSLDAKQRKHAAKLIPFELEDELCANVDSLHFAFAHLQDDALAVLYTGRESCAEPIHTLSQQGCDVRVVLPDYLLLYREPGALTLLLEADTLSVRVSEHWGFSIEQALAPVLLERIAHHSGLAANPPVKLLLFAETEDLLTRLQTWLPDTWADIEQVEEVTDFWGAMALEPSAARLNLRRGSLSRQLPFARWWQIWRLPTYVFAAAFVLAMAFNLGAYYKAKGAEKQVLENMNAVYLDAVPNGRLGDVERMLESKLGGSSADAGEPTNFMFLLSRVSDAVAGHDDTTLTSYSYNGDQRALQLTLQFASLGALGEFRARLTERGIESDSPRTTSVGDGYQARMKVTEAN